MTISRVLLTGAAGQIGESLRTAWEGVFPILRVTDIRPLQKRYDGEEVVRADLARFDEALEVASDVDAIVHLAGVANEAAFDSLLESNIRGTYNVFEAARRRGVRRVVFASTNHVTGFYPRTCTIDVASPIRPDTLYAVSKACGEALGRLYVDKFGLEAVCIRIGAFDTQPRNRRHLSTWLSPKDAAELFQRAILAPSVGFLIVYGASRTSTPFWRHDGPTRLLGYVAADDADAFAAQLAHEEGGGTRSDFFQGGSFTDPSYHGDLRGSPPNGAAAP